MRGFGGKEPMRWASAGDLELKNEAVRRNSNPIWTWLAIDLFEKCPSTYS